MPDAATHPKDDDAQAQLQRALQEVQEQRAQETEEWARRSREELTRFQRDADELYQRSSDQFDQAYQAILTSQEDQRAKQKELDELSVQLQASLEETARKEDEISRRVSEAMEPRLIQSAERVELTRGAVERLLQLNVEMKDQVKRHSVALRALEEYRDELEAQRVLNIGGEVSSERARVDQLNQEVVALRARVDELKQSLQRDRQSHILNVVIAGLIGVIGWFF